MTRRVTLYYGRAGTIEFWMSRDRRRWVVQLRRGDPWSTYHNGAFLHRAGFYLGEERSASRAARLFTRAGEVVFGRRFRWLLPGRFPRFAWERSEIVPARSLRALVEPPVPDPELP